MKEIIEEMNQSDTFNPKAIIKYAGAFIAWVIGSGFATGQEVLQFFTSFGYMSYGAVLLNLSQVPKVGVNCLSVSA